MQTYDAAKQLRELLRLLVRKLGILERSEASGCGITLAQCHAIIELGRAEALTLNDLAERLHLDKSTVSRSVEGLVAGQYVVRQPSAQDRRFVTLTLTAKGQQVYREVESSMAAYFNGILAAVPAEKRTQLVESLTLLVGAVREGHCCETQRTE